MERASDVTRSGDVESRWVGVLFTAPKQWHHTLTLSVGDRDDRSLPPDRCRDPCRDLLGVHRSRDHHLIRSREKAGPQTVPRVMTVLEYQGTTQSSDTHERADTHTATHTHTVRTHTHTPSVVTCCSPRLWIALAALSVSPIYGSLCQEAGEGTTREGGEGVEGKQPSVVDIHHTHTYVMTGHLTPNIQTVSR
jgi:hypothetical protein